MKKNSRILLSSFIGNALEFYDFTLCGVFILTLSKVFFPPLNPTLALFGSIFAFSAAFWTRPLGAFVFGYLGDKFGRKKALTASILMIGLPTFLIGCLPGYESIGLFAPIFLILCRMLQGLSTGGEYNGAAIFSLEHLKKSNPGLVSGIISSSCVFGAITATLISYFVSLSETTWLWRVPFVLGGLGSVIGFYIRKKLDESPEFIDAQKEEKYFNPIKDVFKDYKKPFLKSVIVGFTGGALSYVLFGFLSLYTTRYLGIKLSSGLLYNVFGLLAFMLSCPVFGLLADKLSEKKSLLIACGLSFFLSPVVFYLLQNNGLSYLLIGQILLGIVVCSFVGPTHVYLQTLFPTHLRYTGICVGFSTGLALSGGSIQMVLTALIY